MQLLVSLTNWAAYARGQLALASIEEQDAEGTLALAQARAAARARGERTVAAQKAVAADDPAVHAAMAVVAQAYGDRKGLEAVVDALEAKARVVSRDLTRRTGMRDTENRAAKWTT